jgi:type II secretory pathway pseudopilin PulG
MKTGTTLVELAVALLVLGLLTGLLAPAISGFRDRAAVRVAREQLVALVVEVRRVATERGGAVLVVRSEPAEALLVAGRDTLRTTLWPASLGAPQLVVGGTRSTVELVFDRAGLGRFASATMEFRIGRETSALVLSSYGRVRRR